MRTLILTIATILALASPAQGHLVKGLDRETSLNRAKKVARKVHDVFHNDETAHRWQYVISCESKFRKYARNGQYLGLTQMGEHERARCRWSWDMDRQLKATKCWWELAGWDAWACA